MPVLALDQPSVLAPACPFCHAELARDPSADLGCSDCGYQFPRRAEVDVFLTDTEWRSYLKQIEREQEGLAKYRAARRRSVLNQFYYDNWVKWILREIPRDCHDSLLELMCGEAEICRRLPPSFGRALALDCNVRAVEAAAADLRAAGEHRVQVVCGTAARLPVATASVSAVVIQGGLHHARPLLQPILAEIYRALRPSGVLVGSEPANDHMLTRAIRHWQYRRSRWQGNDPEEDGFTRAELCRLLDDSGLRLEHYRQFGFIAYPLLGNTDLLPWLSRLRWRLGGRLLLCIDRLLEHMPAVRRLAWCSIYRAVKP